jgi:hypothetical protein
LLRQMWASSPSGGMRDSAKYQSCCRFEYVPVIENYKHLQDSQNQA